MTKTPNHRSNKLKEPPNGIINKQNHIHLDTSDKQRLREFIARPPVTKRRFFGRSMMPDRNLDAHKEMSRTNYAKT